MRRIFIISTLILMSLFAAAQRTVYSKDGKTMHFIRQELDIEFSNSAIQIPKSESALPAIAGAALDIVFNLATDFLEKRAKKFTGEYVRTQSNLEMDERKVPDFSLVRTIWFKEGSPHSALEIKFKALQIKNFGFVYYVESINLAYSKALTKSNSRQFDYTIEIKLVTYVGQEKKEIELSPLVITNIGFGLKKFGKPTFRTEIIPLVKDMRIAGVGLKVVETNPAKIKVEKIVEQWNKNKDSLKSILSKLIPEKKESSGSGDGDADAGK
jgi:hypothetical protein